MKSVQLRPNFISKFVLPVIHSIPAPPNLSTPPGELINSRNVSKKLKPFRKLEKPKRAKMNESYQKQLEEAENLYRTASDPTLKELAKAEIEKLKDKIYAQTPSKNLILEIRAGTGGDEAEIFAGELFWMYPRYAQKKAWQVKILNSNKTSLGGIKEIIAEILGNHAFQKLQYESGVHRVQRVPKTEKSGRLHTSAATVAVLPEVDTADIQINPTDLRVDVYRPKRHGGPGVNTTDST